MRMWMVNPAWMCRKHLVGEHGEIHKFVGVLNANGKGKHWPKSLVQKGYIEISSIRSRHDILAEEMINRNYNHKSPLKSMDIDVLRKEYTVADLDRKVDKNKSFKDLLERCPECRRRYKKWLKA